MKILTAKQIKALDEYNITHYNACSIDLMERASIVFTEALLKDYATCKHFAVFAGQGNNGGDGLAIARLLAEKGCRVEIFLFNLSNRLSPECEHNKVRIEKIANVELHEMTSHSCLPDIDKDVVMIDALFGVGLSRPLSGDYRLLAEYINNSGNRVISVDMPSGMLDVECQQSEGDSVIVKASETFTFHCLKPCMLLADNQQFLGRVRVLDIGLNDEHINYAAQDIATTDFLDAKEMLRCRNVYGHKGTFGRALLLAGSKGMAGASILSAQAALRTGLGKLKISCPKENAGILQIAVPETVVNTNESSCAYNLADTSAYNYSAIAIGPGIGQGEDTKAALQELLKCHYANTIIDADGLNLLSTMHDWPSLLTAGTILTPHRAEWMRLLGKEMNDTAMLRHAREYALNYGIYIVLKGHHTAVCTPQGKICFNMSGNSGMATAGSGDVLTGILLGLRAQGYTAEETCRLGVWLHGNAGDFAAKELTQEAMIASDITNHLKDAFFALHNK